MTALANTEPSSGALALRSDQQQWTDQQRAALAQLGVDRASPGDLAVFMHVAQRTGLDPFSRQLYLIGRGGKWTIQTGIDGLRVIAARRAEYAGQVGPQWCGDDGAWRDFWVGRTPPTAARVGVLRSDWAGPVWGVALFSEFSTGQNLWRDKPAHMIAKVAEALALRKAFPHDLAGLVSDDEMSRDDARRSSVAPRVTIHRGPSVTVAELTGKSPARDDASSPTPPRAATAAAAPPVPQGPPLPGEDGYDGPIAAGPPDDTGGEGGEPQTPAQGGDVQTLDKLFPLLRESDIEDRWDWASGVLGRDVTSYGQLSADDIGRLITDLRERPKVGGGSS